MSAGSKRAEPNSTNCSYSSHSETHKHISYGGRKYCYCFVTSMLVLQNAMLAKLGDDYKGSFKKSDRYMYLVTSRWYIPAALFQIMWLYETDPPVLSVNILTAYQDLDRLDFLKPSDKTYLPCRARQSFCSLWRLRACLDSSRFQSAVCNKGWGCLYF